MKIINSQRLMGVNRWFGDRTFAATVTGVPEQAVPAQLLQTLAEALDRLALPAHQDVAGERMRRAMPPGADWGRCLAELTAELQFLSGEYSGGRIAQTLPARESVQVAVECQEFAPAEACLMAAVQSCARLLRGEPLELAPLLDDLIACVGDACLGGSTGPIVAAGRRRGIPAYRLDRESLVQLGEGIHQQRICTAMTGRTSHIAVQVSTDKHLVNQLWLRLGIPIAAGRLVQGEEDAIRAAGEIGWPIVVKPADADYGRGVSLPVRTIEHLRAAYGKARACSSTGRVLVQRYLRGASHRLLAVAGRLVAAVRRDPISIVGDGRHSVRELVEQANRATSWGWDYRASLGEAEQALLAEAGLGPEAVPAPGVKVPLRHDVMEIYSNVLERVHPETRDLASDAARVIGLDVAGLDVIAVDIGRPLAEQGGGFLEINAQPAIALHRAPHCDRPQAVGEDIAASLFPPPACGRVPLVIVIGSEMADDVARFTAELLRRGGRQVAASTPHQTYWNHRHLVPDSAAPADRLAALMLHPRTEAAVLSVRPADIVQAGLGSDQCQVLVLADGIDGTADVDVAMWPELLRRLTAATHRCVVNLDDAYWGTCAAVSIPTTVLTSADPVSPQLQQHRATGRVVAFQQGGEIVVRAAEVELMRIPAGDPKSLRMAQVLAAAAVFALGLDI